MIKFYVGVDFENGVELETSFGGTGEEIAKTIAMGIAFFEEKNGFKKDDIFIQGVLKAYKYIDSDMRKMLVEGAEKC